ncbi:MAG: helix-turn-helix domain-containing protein [Caldilineaceae bacterium]
MTLAGTISVRKLNRVKILLLADEGHEDGQKTDREIAEKLEISPATVGRVRKRYVESGIKAAINEEKRSGPTPGFNGVARANITALACSTPPDGFAKWSLRLLADKAVELELVESISFSAVGKILKKTWSNPPNPLVVFREADHHFLVANGKAAGPFMRNRIIPNALFGALMSVLVS